MISNFAIRRQGQVGGNVHFNGDLPASDFRLPAYFLSFFGNPDKFFPVKNFDF